VSCSVVDFFSGCGGTSLGLRNAGMSIIAGIDNDPDVASTYRKNFPEARFFERDIREIQPKEIEELLPTGKIVFSGCAPCQPFSKQNRTKKNSDPRSFLLGEFQRFVTSIRPDYVIVENVPGLQRVGTDGPLATFIDAVRAINYGISWAILAASHFGVPQVRRRLVLVAVKDSRTALMPISTHGQGRHPLATVREWMSGLPDLLAGETDPNDPDHTAMSLSPVNMRRIAATPEGRGRESWPPTLLLECHTGHTGHSDVYGRLAWDKPASAMTTR